MTSETLRRFAFVAALTVAVALAVAVVVVLFTQGPSFVLGSIVASALAALLILAGVWPHN